MVKTCVCHTHTAVVLYLRFDMTTRHHQIVKTRPNQTSSFGATLRVAGNGGDGVKGVTPENRRSMRVAELMG